MREKGELNYRMCSMQFIFDNAKLSGMNANSALTTAVYNILAVDEYRDVAVLLNTLADRIRYGMDLYCGQNANDKSFSFRAKGYVHRDEKAVVECAVGGMSVFESLRKIPAYINIGMRSGDRNMLVLLMGEVYTYDGLAEVIKAAADAVSVECCCKVEHRVKTEIYAEARNGIAIVKGAYAGCQKFIAYLDGLVRCLEISKVDNGK